MLPAAPATWNSTAQGQARVDRDSHCRRLALPATGGRTRYREVITNPRVLALTSIRWQGKEVRSRGELVEIAAPFACRTSCVGGSGQSCRSRADRSHHLRGTMPMRRIQRKTGLLRLFRRNYAIQGFTPSVPEQADSRPGSTIRACLCDDWGSGQPVDMASVGLLLTKPTADGQACPRCRPVITSAVTAARAAPSGIIVEKRR